MKTVIKQILMGFGFISVPLALMAATAEKLDVTSYDLPVYKVEGQIELPIPVRQVAPIVQSGMVGITIKMKFTVDEKGFPRGVQSAIPLFNLGLVNEKERDLAVQMTGVLSRWKFEPATDANGQPVAVKLIMPVSVIEREKLPVVTVTMMLENPDVDRF